MSIIFYKKEVGVPLGSNINTANTTNILACSESHELITLLSPDSAIEVAATPFDEAVAGSIEAAGDSLEVDFAGKSFNHHVFSFTVASINTSVELAIFGKAGAEATESNVGEVNSTITANGRYTVRVNDTPLAKVYLKVVAEVGGTSVVISDVVYKGSN
jgi:hypothetical protein